jgi:hypothetical protein
MQLESNLGARAMKMRWTALLAVAEEDFEH